MSLAGPILLSSVCLLTLPLVAQEARSSDEMTEHALLNPDAQAWRVEAPPRFRARFETSEGTFIVEAERRLAPIGVDHFFPDSKQPH